VYKDIFICITSFISYITSVL